MTKAIEGLKPELVWKYFAEISRIPRPSQHEKAVADFVLSTAKAQGLSTQQDEFGNVAVKKPATPGRENYRSVALQGHLDMVCEKNADKVHDFFKDPIELVRKDNVLMANGTTLGADNGIAVATNLAIMADRTIEHGPLELLFTVDEETGLTGASNLRGDFLESRTLINLDSEEEGALYVGCAGGKNTLGTWKVDFEKAPGNFMGVRLEVKGLIGGHSGLEIDKGRGNSIKILNRVLMTLTGLEARLSSLKGGNKSNAIPRETEALLFLPKKRWKDANAVVQESNSTVKAEFVTVDPDLAIALTKVDGNTKAKVIKRSQQNRLCLTISALPHGVTKMSADVPGLVETSTNVAVVTTNKKEVALTTSQRSSVKSEILEVCQTVASIFELGKAKVEHSEGYPGWKPNLDSPILKTARSTYQSLYGKDPAVKAVHAGLECGILGEKFPGMDMVSFGPTLEGVHSPDEKIYLDSVERFYNFLVAILRNIN